MTLLKVIHRIAVFLFINWLKCLQDVPKPCTVMGIQMIYLNLDCLRRLLASKSQSYVMWKDVEPCFTVRAP